MSMSEKFILVAPSTFAKNSSEPLDRLKELDINLIMNSFRRKISDIELNEIFNNNSICGSLAGLETYDKKILNHPDLKIISRLGSGVDNIDNALAKKLGIKVFNTPDAPTDAVAEITIGMMLSLLRKTFYASENFKNKKWHREFGNLLQKKTVLIIGYGKIGKKIHKLLNAFDANCIIYDPFLETKNVHFFKDICDALKLADIVTCHASGNKEILGQNEFQFIKKNAIILNCARGVNVSEKCLISALNNNLVSSAWIDVFNEEPYNGELLSCNKAILTPHISSYTVETRIKMENEAVTNLINNLYN